MAAPTGKLKHAYETIANMENIINRLSTRLEIEAAQFKQIRLYTKDGDLACICAEHETNIKELLKNKSGK